MTTPSIRQYAVHLLTGITCAVVGCQSPRVDANRSRSEALPATVSQGIVASDASWEAIKSALRDARFRLDRVDRAAGVITTSPMSSQHFFEFWRHDVDTFHDWVDATINPVRRRVTVTLAPEGGEQAATLTVEVRKERLSAPDRQFNSPGAAFEFFGSRLPSTTGKPKLSAADETWLDAGRDPAMEAWLLGTILARSVAPRASDAPRACEPRARGVIVPCATTPPFPYPAFRRFNHSSPTLAVARMGHPSAFRPLVISAFRHFPIC